jgi:sugar lactone lactonase YvrE
MRSICKTSELSSLQLLYSIQAILLVASLFFTGCSDQADKSFDFTQEGLFTAGIEGPAVDGKGNLYAVNFEKEGTIGIVDSLGNASLFAELPDGSIGNGIRFDERDNMYVADYVNHNVLMIPVGTNEVKVFAHDPRLNQPNDLAIAPNGILFASDPNWEKGTGQLWRVDENGFHLLEDEMGTTNGIEVSPDGKHLYVNESLQRRIWRYDLDGEGNVTEKTLFYQFDDHGLDGMRSDLKGNLYVCRYDAGMVVVLNPEGHLIREVKLTGEKPSNITFGGKDGKQCFVTLADRGCFESFYAQYPGRRW